MGIFNDNNDDFFNEDDFMSRWDKLSKGLNDDSIENRKKFFQEMMDMLLNNMDNNKHSMDFRIIPLDNDFKIPEDELDIERGEDESGTWESKSWTSPDGTISFSSFSRSSGYSDELNDDLGDLWNKKTKNKDKLSEKNKELKINKLQKALDYAVEQEKYEKAAEIKKMIDDIRGEKK